MDKTDEVMAVLTQDTIEKILKDGGSGNWVLDPKRANAFKYLVCCRKLRWDNRSENIPNRAPFLVGAIKGFTEHKAGEEGRGQKRYFIEFSSYALVANPKPPKEERDWRNPIAYRTFQDLDIDPTTLEFKSLPEPAQEAARSEDKPMTIAEAKRALAKSFGVNPDDIDIVIRG